MPALSRVLLLTALLALTLSATAQPEAATPQVPAPMSDLVTQREALTERIARAAEAATPEHAEQLGLPVERLREREAVLKEARYHVNRAIDSLSERTRVDEQAAALASQIEAFTGLPDPPPYTIDYVDALVGELDTTLLEIETVQDERQNAEARLALAKAGLAEAETALALRKETTGEAPSARELWELQFLQDSVGRARAATEYWSIHGDVLQARMALLERERDWQRRKVEIARDNLVFTPDQLAAKQETLQARRDGLTARIEQVQKAYQGDAQRATQARQAADEATAAGADPQRVQALQAIAESARVIAQNSLAQYELLRDFQESYDRELRLWEIRLQVYAGEDIRPLELLRLIDDGLQQIAQLRETATRRLLTLRANAGAVDRRLEGADTAGADERRWLRSQADSYRQVEETLGLWLARLLEMQQLVGQVREEASERLAMDPLGERWQRFLAHANAVWNYRLVEIEGGALTVRKVAVALLIFLAGVVLSRLFARWLRGVALNRLHIEEGAAISVSKGAYYVLLLFVGYYALKVVNIPLTVFTFFGGALAIGVGFGAQNLINNFISGIILMIERPIRINDIVEVDNEGGRIVSIGARCSRMRRFSGVEVLIPNSSFLERSVINWTLSDSVLRFSVSVGVAHGSPTREVSRLIMKAVEEHGQILKDPEPVVLFSDFRDSALVFEVFFWIRLNDQTDSRVIRSDIRHRIDKLFREAGITVAYPQRDVHLNTLEPLEVRLVGPVKESGDQDATLP